MDPAQRGHEVFDISKDDIRRVLAGVVREALAATGVTVQAEVKRALDRARGRVD